MKMNRNNIKMSSIQYLNTDLDIESESDLTPIVEAFGEDVIVMFHGKRRGLNLASFEIAHGHHADANGTIEYFCDLIENLNENERAIWNSCCSRILDIGYECGSSPQNYRTELRPDTIKRVADTGASIVVTIYPAIQEEKM